MYCSHVPEIFFFFFPGKFMTSNHFPSSQSHYLVIILFIIFADFSYQSVSTTLVVEYFVWLSLISPRCTVRSYIFHQPTLMTCGKSDVQFGCPILSLFLLSIWTKKTIILIVVLLFFLWLLNIDFWLTRNAWLLNNPRIYRLGSQ